MSFKSRVRQGAEVREAVAELIVKWNALMSRGFFGRMKWLLFGR